jgi:hypothetical protein
MTENNRIEYKRELNERLEKEALKGDAIISGPSQGVESGVESAIGLNLNKLNRKNSWINKSPDKSGAAVLNHGEQAKL